MWGQAWLLSGREAKQLGQLFNDLSAREEEWANSIYDRAATDILASSSSQLKELIAEEQLSAAIKNMSSEYGPLCSSVYVRVQYLQWAVFPRR